MKHLIKYICAATIMMAPLTVSAQQTYSGYFTDNYLFRHDMNPAFGNDKNYVAMPALGNFNFAMQGNLAVNKFIFNRNGMTTTFLNPSVSTSEFLSGIKDDNKIMGEVKLQILGAGFKAFGGYNTFEVNVRSDFGFNLPGDMFRLVKEGLSNKTYDFSGMGARVNAFAEVALGHSRQITEQLRVGAKYKVLLGGANIDAKFNTARVDLNENAWNITSNAEIQSSLKGLTYETTTEMRGPEGNETEHRYVDNMDIDSPGLNGFGMAIDLGAEYKFNDDWTFSAALLDLGYISWKNNMVASTNGDRHFTTDAYQFSTNDDADNSFEREMDRLTEGLATLGELQDMGDKGSRSTSLGATLNLGAEYTLPFNHAVTLGLTSTTRFNGDYSWTKFRLSANANATKWFSTGVNLGIGTYGAEFGCIVSVAPKGFNFFIAMDSSLRSLSKQGVPLSSNGSVNMGINIPF